jgi:hypothetical protein
LRASLEPMLKNQRASVFLPLNRGTHDHRDLVGVKLLRHLVGNELGRRIIGGRNQSEPTDSHGDALGVHIAKRGKVGFDFRKGISHGLTVHRMTRNNCDYSAFNSISSKTTSKWSSSIRNYWRFSRVDILRVQVRGLGSLSLSPDGRRDEIESHEYQCPRRCYGSQPCIAGEQPSDPYPGRALREV